TMSNSLECRWLLNSSKTVSEVPGALHLTLLSTYLGHVNPATSYWYLSAAPELLIKAAERLERPPGEQA
ncbi:hypothetical protein AB6804_31860, partial [Caballeronia sp. RCC_10]